MANEKPASGVFSKLRRSAPPPEPQAAVVEGVDTLTRLPSRHALHDLLSEAVFASKRDSSTAVLAFVEIGELRDINDTFGPDVGDAVLEMAADRLRSIDLPGTAVVRYEGAVFGAVFPAVPHLSGAEETAKFLVELMSEPFAVGSESITIGTHVGGAISTDNYDTLDDMVRDAFHALISAREAGLGAWVMHDETKRARYSTRIDDRRLQDAIDNEEFHLQYQPIVRLDTGEMVGLEALIRWTQPGATNSGMLFPHDFLPQLEKSGLIVRVGQWVLNEACRQIRDWMTRFPDRPLAFVSCNIGARQLADASFYDSVTQAVSDSGVGPGTLCIDLTEEALRYNRFQRESAWAALRGLKDMGVKLGIDDFGTGMASLSHLREFRLDALRFHRNFVTGLGVSREDSVIIKHITAMAHDLECVTIAEGVEDAAQQDHLRQLGVDMAQGFHFGKPLSPEQIEERLRPDDESNPARDRWDASNVLES